MGGGLLVVGDGLGVFVQFWADLGGFVQCAGGGEVVRTKRKVLINRVFVADLARLVCWRRAGLDWL